MAQSYGACLESYRLAKNNARPLKLPTKSKRLRDESKILWNDARTIQGADFFTFGYEARTTDEIFENLRLAEVKCVLDIRYNPVSMYRPDLSKSNFQRRLTEAGIDYVHIREWGVPRHIRARAIETGDRKTIWDWYDENVVAPNFVNNLHRFLNLGNPVAMMCMECDPTECHRHRIFLALEKQGLRGFDL
jgi:uncharacterized protein (DUF488 family)